MSLEQRMNQFLGKVGLEGWTCVWTPDASKKMHGEILPRDRLILIYSSTNSEAWLTLLHEVLELRLRRVLKPYRLLVNSLIEVLEKTAYLEKERFLEDLPGILRVFEASGRDGFLESVATGQSLGLKEEQGREVEA